MGDRFYENLTITQRKVFNKCYKIAHEYFNVQKGWVLHHTDTELKYKDVDRYIEWRTEDLQLMTKQEHMRLHMLLDNPMNNADSRAKISEAMSKYKSIPRGTCCNMSEEAYKTMHSKATSNRNKTMWKDEAYRAYMIEVSHASQRQAVQWLETGRKYKCLRDAEKDHDIKISRPSITKSAQTNTTIKGYTFSFIDEEVI